MNLDLNPIVRCVEHDRLVKMFGVFSVGVPSNWQNSVAQGL